MWIPVSSQVSTFFPRRYTRARWVFRLSTVLWMIFAWKKGAGEEFDRFWVRRISTSTIGSFFMTKLSIKFKHSKIYTFYYIFIPIWQSTCTILVVAHCFQHYRCRSRFARFWLSHKFSHSERTTTRWDMSHGGCIKNMGKKSETETRAWRE